MHIHTHISISIYIFIYRILSMDIREIKSPRQKMTFPTFCSEQFIPNTWNHRIHFCHNPPRYISVSLSFFHYVPSHMNFTVLNRCIHICPPKRAGTSVSAPPWSGSSPPHRLEASLNQSWATRACRRSTWGCGDIPSGNLTGYWKWHLLFVDLPIFKDGDFHSELFHSELLVYQRVVG